MSTDTVYMEQCLELAEIALENGDSPVGSLLVYEGKIIGKGVESGKSSGDITNHAEIIAIRNAIENGFAHHLPSSVLYSTHEPCIMCSYVIRHHKIPQIIYGIDVDDVGGYTSHFPILKIEVIPKWGKKPVVKTGICETSCNELTRRQKK